MQEVFALPLSFGQRRLWFLNQLEPGSPFYNILSAIRLSGNLNVEALEQSLRQIIQRHEILRTTFTEVEGEPVQIIAPDLSFALSVIDLPRVPEAARETVARQIASEKTLEPFDLENGPLLRAHLLRLGQQDHLLLLVMHHIISDGWSVGVILREMASLYAAAINDKPSPLPDLPLQYADFAIWQQNWLQGEVFDSQLNYWQEKLGQPPVLELPTDRPRPPVQTYLGATEYFTLTESLSESLKSLSKQEGATLFMTLLAAFNTLLYRYTGQEDIVVGTAVTNRNRTELQSLIGFFVNTLAIRTDLSGDPGFRPLMRQVKKTLAEAFANQDLPFERLVDELQLKRDISRSPLFQVMFTLETAEQNQIAVPGLELSQFIVASETTIFDLLFQMADHGPNISGALHYNTDLFNRDTIERMLKNFERLLEALAASPDQKISLLPMLSDDELRRLLIKFNDTRKSYPQNVRMDELFEGQVSRTPDNVALVFDRQRLTYRELDERANQLAHYLKGGGVGPDVLVGVCAHRSLEMVIGLLGILKAGGAYVPLDPEYPKERLAFIIEDARLDLLLTQGHLTDSLPVCDANVLCLDTDWGEVSIQPALPCANASKPDNLAYAIYTSGSTGKPKGVMISHSGICNRLLWMQDEYGLEECDSVLQKTSFGFDVSVWEFFWPLTVGARLVMARPGGHRDPQYLVDEIRGQGITTLHFVPAMLQAFLDEPASGLCESLKRVICSGEALSYELQEKFYSRLGADLHNLYGPTEASVDVTYWECERGAALRVVPIGRPIANTQIYILNAGMQAEPVGVAGELYIGGVGLGRGYIYRPDLTAERFIPNPYGQAGGERLYRTGDLGRYRADGMIEYLGRSDNQVKVRGIRIEPGEIETVLRQHEKVLEAAVVLREDAAAGKMLVGYVVTKQDGVTNKELKAFVKARLPEYMVPGMIVMLEEMPLTPSGKLDRRGLPQVRREEEAEEERGGYGSIYEEMLGQIWAGVLGMNGIGRSADFFDLGGHSLLATKLVSRVRESMKVEMPVRAVFGHSRLSDMASWIEKAKKDTPGRQDKIERIERGSPIKLSYAQQRLWFLDQLEPGSASYNIAAGVKLTGELDVDALERSINEVVGRHEALRTTFVEEGGEPRQVIHQEMRVEMVREDLSHLQQEERGQELERRMREVASAPFELRRGPLIRAWLMKVGEQEQVLVITLHHIISDGWSTGVMVGELSAFYEAAVTGKDAGLPELEVQYADYAEWQRGQLQGEVLERQLAYWKDKLEGASVLQLPTDRQRPPVQTYHGSTQSFITAPQVTSSLKLLSLASGVTLFMTLLSAFKVILHRYSGQQDIIVGTPLAGRNRIELEPLIGLFVNTLVLRTDFSDDPTFRQVLCRVRETSLESYAHDDLPFERLVEELQTERDLSRNPLFQVMFLFQNERGQELDMPGVKASLIPWHTDTAKFDLTLAVQDDGEQLRAEIEYNTDLYDSVTIRRMAGHFEKALAQLVEDVDRKVSSIDLLSDSERFELIEQWNFTHVDYQGEHLLHKAFEGQVSRTPDNVALVFDRQRLTYRELDERANQLAHYLKGGGVGPDVLVGVCAHRSLEMVIGLLGILKAGGAYVPLDPEYPKERLAFIIEDARLDLLLTQGHLTDSLPVCDANVLCLDTDWGEVSIQPALPCANASKPDNLAYAIYTSGSTGKPKGVMISHSGICNRLLWMQDEYGLEECDSVLQKTSFGFDVSVWEFFWPLTVGARLVMARPGGHRDPQYLVDEIRGQGITTLHFVPAMLQAFLDEPASGLCESLKRVICSGEALSYELQEKFYSRLGADLHNLYGPTEASVDVTYWECERGAALRVVPIGRPIANTQIYILNAGMQAEPVGVAGELYIGGVGLGRGYIYRPDLTAERFVPNPFDRAFGSRLYATGDLARFLADGSIEYIGRLDQQVKIRGFRVELGEIEETLRWHEGVAEVAVIARCEPNDTKQIVAYVVFNAGQTPAAVELRNHLKKSLPDFMLPASFVALERMPLTPNGKIDRQALPSPDAYEQQAGHDYTPPQTPTEEVLANIFCEVLGRDKVGIHDNFFELGGHSLLATRVNSWMRDAFQIEMPLRRLFESPSIAGLGTAVDQMICEGCHLEAPPIVSAPRDGNLPLSFAQQRLWFVSQLDPETPAYNLDTIVRLKGELNMAAIERSLNEIVARHEILRTTFPVVDGQPVQVIAQSADLKPLLVDLSDVAGEERDATAQRLIEADVARPFDLTNGPLLRVTLLRLAERNHIAIFTMHHIISDGWSMGILIREISTLYEAFLLDKPSPLRPLPVQYADFAVWQRNWLQGEVLERQLAY